MTRENNTMNLKKIIILTSLFIISCITDNKAYNTAIEFLKSDSVIKNNVGSNIKIDGITWQRICTHDADNKYGGAFALFEMLIKDKKGESIRVFVLLKFLDNKWVGDKIIYNPNDNLYFKIHTKYAFD